MVLDRFKKSHKITGDYIVGLDVGTEFAKALIARVDGDELVVVGSGKSRQDVSNMHSGAIADISGVVQCCEDALAQAEEEAGLQAKRAIIGIAGELVKGTTTVVRYRRPQPDKVLDEDEMEFIIDKVQSRAREKAQAQIGLETGNDQVEVKLVNSAIVSIHIDGYKVSNPLGFQGKDVAVQIYTAFAPMMHIGALEKVADELALDLIAVAAEPFAVSRSVIGNDANSSFSAIMIDVGGGTTDIAVVNDGGVEGTKMFAIGGRSFTRTIESTLNVDYREAEKLKLNIDNEKLKLSVKEKLDEAVDKTAEVWLDGIWLALSEFKNVDHLPSRVLLCGGGSSLTKLTEVLREPAWYDGLPFASDPDIQLINTSEVSGITTTPDVASDHTFITAMGLLRVGYDTIVSVEDTGSVKSKLNKILKI